MPRLTFKRAPKETGLAAVGHPNADVYIKCDGKVVGVITARRWNKSTWDPQISVVKKDINEDGNPNCEWKWIFLGNYDSETMAREAVSSLWNSLCQEHTFHVVWEE